MSILEQLSTNKGTVSSALGKALARKVLQESRADILLECVELASHEAPAAAAKHIRAGAAKVVETVAQEQPEMVAPHLGKLLPALSVREPQTRWMAIRAMGFCAHLNQPTARRAIPFAAKYLDDKEGLCIASSADLFLGDLGAVSATDAETVFPILEQSMGNPVTNEQDWLLEAFIKLFHNLRRPQQTKVLRFATRWQCSSRKSTRQRAMKLLRLGGR